MKKGLKILLGIVIAFAAVIGIGILAFNTVTSNSIKELDKVPTVDVKDVADGEYEGFAESGPVYVDVKVTVKNHTIENIELITHRCGTGQPAEALLGIMLQNNNTEVDAVSGATVSSKAMKAAVNNALSKGVNVSSMD